MPTLSESQAEFRLAVVANDAAMPATLAEPFIHGRVWGRLRHRSRASRPRRFPAAAPENADLVVFDIDFDSQKDVLRQFNVRQQSTLIAFHGAEERSRAVGITDPAAIAALVATTR